MIEGYYQYIKKSNIISVKTITSRTLTLNIPSDYILFKITNSFIYIFTIKRNNNKK